MTAERALHNFRGYGNGKITGSKGTHGLWFQAASSDRQKRTCLAENRNPLGYLGSLSVMFQKDKGLCCGDGRNLKPTLSPSQRLLVLISPPFHCGPDPEVLNQDSLSGSLPEEDPVSCNG